MPRSSGHSVLGCVCAFLHTGHCANVESGRVNPRISTLYKVAKVLNVTLSDLLMIE